MSLIKEKVKGTKHEHVSGLLSQWFTSVTSDKKKLKYKYRDRKDDVMLCYNNLARST